jgi:zinc/manganese transport system substrate-binding protein
VRDKSTIDRQIARRQIKVWVFNSQNSMPDVQRITDAARRRGIPVTTITETLTPASATFQSWQSRQLQALAGALAKATGR